MVGGEFAKTRGVDERPDVESSTPAYAARFSGEVGSWMIGIQQRATIGALEKWVNLRVLDVGGGHGQNVAPLVAERAQLTVLGSTDQCQQLIAREIASGQVQFVQGSIIDIPLPDRSVDVCLSYRMLAHLVHWRKHIEELCRVAERAVLVDFPFRRSVNIASAILFRLKRRIERNTRPFTCYSEGQIEEAFALHGFRAFYRYPQYSLPMAMHRTLGSAAISSRLEQALRSAGCTGLIGSPIIAGFCRRDTK